MSRPRSFSVVAQSIFCALLFWLAAAQTLLAQEGEEKKEPKSYVLGYSLAVACIGLGLFVVVRMGKRKAKKIKKKEENWD